MKKGMYKSRYINNAKIFALVNYIFFYLYSEIEKKCINLQQSNIMYQMYVL